MKVLLLTDADVFAGTERHMLELALALDALPRSAPASADLKVELACPDPSPLANLARANGITVHGIAKSGLADWRAVQELRRLLRHEHFDVLHAHNGRTALLAAAAVHLARSGQLVITQHFLTPNHLQSRGLKRQLTRWVHARVNQSARGFIAISDAVRVAMIDRGQAPPSRISTIPNGISDVDASALKSGDEVRDGLAVSPSSPLVICVARLEAEKGLSCLISAMATVSLRVPGVKCIIVGAGSRLLPLQKQIEAADLCEAVRLTGFAEDVLSIVAASDVFVLPSPAEPFGLVLLEAMALERPVVAMRSGGPLEIVEDGVTGILVVPGQAPALAEALIELLEDAPRRSKMGQNGRERFLARYNAKLMAERTLETYRLALLNPPAARRNP